MIEHKANIITGSVKQHGMGISFIVRCCDDSKTDFPVTVNNIHKFNKDELTAFKQQIIEKRQRQHEAVDKLAEHLASEV